MFNVEQFVFLEKDDNFNDDHVFVAGLARSGTTMLLNAIYQSDQFASLTYDDMPFILAPNFWAKISPTKVHGEPQERMHGDGVKVTTNSPEAFEEVFWKTFSDDSKNCRELFINFVSLILKKNHKTRYLSKNNQNIRRLKLISEYFPRSKILIPFRDPLQQALSLFSQHKRFIKKANEDSFVRQYMDWIGHSEFGLDYKIINKTNLQYSNENNLNHWLEQWHLTYQFIFNLLTENKNIYLICYEKLCHDPKVWLNIKNLVNINSNVEFNFIKSKKNFQFVFDNNLSEKCNKLYKSLISISV